MEDPVDACAIKQFLQDFTPERGSPNNEENVQLRSGIVGNYYLTLDDVEPQVLDWTLHYLEQRKCPPTLAVTIARIVAQNIAVGASEVIHHQAINMNGDGDDPRLLLESTQLHSQSIGHLHELCNHWREHPEEAIDETRDAGTVRYQVSVYAIKNGRRKMEDRHVVIHDLNALLALEDYPFHSYYAVFDGHAGIDAASFAAAHLHVNLVHHPCFLKNTEQAVKDAFNLTDQEILERSARENVKSGCTAVCCLIREKTLYVAWVGDSQVILVRKGVPVSLMSPHKPERADERKRIEELGGSVIYTDTWRVNGTLAVSRALGDPEHKPYVSSEPDIVSTEFDGSEDFLVIACDGLWDRLSPANATALVYQYIKEKPDAAAENVAQQLVNHAKDQGSSDNITAVVVFLRDVKSIAESAVEPPAFFPRLQGVSLDENINGSIESNNRLNAFGLQQDEMVAKGNPFGLPVKDQQGLYQDMNAYNFYPEGYNYSDTSAQANGFSVSQDKLMPEPTTFSELPTPPIDEVVASQQMGSAAFDEYDVDESYQDKLVEKEKDDVMHRDELEEEDDDISKEKVKEVASEVVNTAIESAVKVVRSKTPDADEEEPKIEAEMDELKHTEGTDSGHELEEGNMPSLGEDSVSDYFSSSPNPEYLRDYVPTGMGGDQHVVHSPQPSPILESEEQEKGFDAHSYQRQQEEKMDDYNAGLYSASPYDIGETPAKLGVESEFETMEVKMPAASGLEEVPLHDKADRLSPSVYDENIPICADKPQDVVDFRSSEVYDEMEIGEAKMESFIEKSENEPVSELKLGPSVFDSNVNAELAAKTEILVTDPLGEFVQEDTTAVATEKEAPVDGYTDITGSDIITPQSTETDLTNVSNDILETHSLPSPTLKDEGITNTSPEPTLVSEIEMPVQNITEPECLMNIVPDRQPSPLENPESPSPMSSSPLPVDLEDKSESPVPSPVPPMLQPTSEELSASIQDSQSPNLLSPRSPLPASSPEQMDLHSPRDIKSFEADDAYLNKDTAGFAPLSPSPSPNPASPYSPMHEDAYQEHPKAFESLSPNLTSPPYSPIPNQEQQAKEEEEVKTELLPEEAPSRILPEEVPGSTSEPILEPPVEETPIAQTEPVLEIPVTPASIAEVSEEQPSQLSTICDQTVALTPEPLSPQALSPQLPASSAGFAAQDAAFMHEGQKESPDSDIMYPETCQNLMTGLESSNIQNALDEQLLTENLATQQEQLESEILESPEAEIAEKEIMDVEHPTEKDIVPEMEINQQPEIQGDVAHQEQNTVELVPQLDVLATSPSDITPKEEPALLIEPEMEKQPTLPIETEVEKESTLLIGTEVEKEPSLSIEPEVEKELAVPIEPKAEKEPALPIEPEAEKEPALPIEPEAEKEPALPIEPEAEKEPALPIEPEAEKEPALPIEPEAEKEPALPIEPEAEKEPALPIEPEAEKEPALPIEPEAEKEPALPIEPEAEKEPALPIEPEAEKEPALPTEPEVEKEPALPTEPEVAKEPTLPIEPEAETPMQIEEAIVEPIVPEVQKEEDIIKEAIAVAESQPETETIVEPALAEPCMEKAPEEKVQPVAEQVSEEVAPVVEQIPPVSDLDLAKADVIPPAEKETVDEVKEITEPAKDVPVADDQPVENAKTELIPEALPMESKPAEARPEPAEVQIEAIPEGVPEAEGVTEDVDSDSEKDGGWSYIKMEEAQKKAEEANKAAQPAQKPGAKIKSQVTDAKKTVKEKAKPTSAAPTKSPSAAKLADAKRPKSASAATEKISKTTAKPEVKTAEAKDKAKPAATKTSLTATKKTETVAKKTTTTTTKAASTKTAEAAAKAKPAATESTAKPKPTATKPTTAPSSRLTSQASKASPKPPASKATESKPAASQKPTASPASRPTTKTSPSKPAAGSTKPASSTSPTKPLAKSTTATDKPAARSRPSATSSTTASKSPAVNGPAKPKPAGPPKTTTMVKADNKQTKETVNKQISSGVKKAATSTKDNGALKKAPAATKPTQPRPTTLASKTDASAASKKPASTAPAKKPGQSPKVAAASKGKEAPKAGQLTKTPVKINRKPADKTADTKDKKLKDTINETPTTPEQEKAALEVHTKEAPPEASATPTPDQSQSSPVLANGDLHDKEQIDAAFEAIEELH